MIMNKESMMREQRKILGKALNENFFSQGTYMTNSG